MGWPVLEICWTRRQWLPHNRKPFLKKHSRFHSLHGHPIRIMIIFFQINYPNSESWTGKLSMALNLRLVSGIFLSFRYVIKIQFISHSHMCTATVDILLLIFSHRKAFKPFPLLSHRPGLHNFCHERNFPFLFIFVDPYLTLCIINVEKVWAEGEEIVKSCYLSRICRLTRGTGAFNGAKLPREINHFSLKARSVLTRSES